MIYAIVLFAVTYVLMLAFVKYRTYMALGSAAIFIISGMLPFDQVFSSIDFNVLLMIAGTMGLVQLFIDRGRGGTGRPPFRAQVSWRRG